MAFHDAFNVDSPGVARALRPLLWRTNEWRVCGVVDSLIWVRRVARNGMGDRIPDRGSTQVGVFVTDYDPSMGPMPHAQGAKR